MIWDSPENKLRIGGGSDGGIVAAEANGELLEVRRTAETLGLAHVDTVSARHVGMDS